MGLSPTQRTLKALREQGVICGIVERYLANVGPFGVRNDLFGIIDIIALHPEKGIVGIQSCGQSYSAHMKGMLEGDERDVGRDLSKPEACREWIKAGGVLQLWGWRKVKLKRGGKAMRWKPRFHEFTIEEFENDTEAEEHGSEGGQEEVGGSSVLEDPWQAQAESEG
jgi:hypothetical protein